MSKQIDATKYVIAVDLKASAGGGFRFLKLYNEKESFAFAEAERVMAGQPDDWFCFHICKRGKRVAGCGVVWRYDSLARRYNGDFGYDDMKKERAWAHFEIPPCLMF